VLREQNGLQNRFAPLNPYRPAPQARGSEFFEARKSCDFLASQDIENLLYM
jgi:hypothetical protein